MPTLFTLHTSEWLVVCCINTSPVQVGATGRSPLWITNLVETVFAQIDALPLPRKRRMAMALRD